MTTAEQRKQRLASGSRRKRDGYRGPKAPAAIPTLGPSAEEESLRSRVIVTKSPVFAWNLAVQLLADELDHYRMAKFVAPMVCRGEVDGLLFLDCPAGLFEYVDRVYRFKFDPAIREVSHFEGCFIGMGESWL